MAESCRWLFQMFTHLQVLGLFVIKLLQVWKNETGVIRYFSLCPQMLQTKSKPTIVSLQTFSDFPSLAALHPKPQAVNGDVNL